MFACVSLHVHICACEWQMTTFSLILQIPDLVFIVVYYFIVFTDLKLTK